MGKIGLVWVYWSWIDTYLIMTEERHPDQSLSWYSLTMTQIELNHCFDSTVFSIRWKHFFTFNFIFLYIINPISLAFYLFLHFITFSVININYKKFQI